MTILDPSLYNVKIVRQDTDAVLTLKNIPLLGMGMTSGVFRTANNQLRRRSIPGWDASSGLTHLKLAIQRPYHTLAIASFLEDCRWQFGNSGPRVTIIDQDVGLDYGAMPIPRTFEGLIDMLPEGLLADRHAFSQERWDLVIPVDKVYDWVENDRRLPNVLQLLRMNFNYTIIHERLPDSAGGLVLGPLPTGLTIHLATAHRGYPSTDVEWTFPTPAFAATGQITAQVDIDTPALPGTYTCAVQWSRVGFGAGNLFSFDIEVV
jgi:hypothetical protein